MDNLTILDTETASLTGPVCEIAYLKVTPTLEIVESYRTLVNPGVPINPKATEIHGITDSDVVDAPTMAEVVRQLNGPVFLIAHNAQFDRRMIEKDVQVVDEFCTLRMAKRHFADLEKHTLESLVAHFQLGEFDAHSALGDVMAVHALLVNTCSYLGMSFPELIADQKIVRILHKMPNGKHRGRPIPLVSQQYREWLLEQPNLDPDLKHTLETFRGI